MLPKIILDRGDSLSDNSGCMRNLGSMAKADFIIIGTSRQRRKLTRITPADIVRNVGVTFDSDHNFRKFISLTYRCSFYHIRDFRRIRHYISISVAKTITTALITCRLNYCNSVLYNIASKDILKLQFVQNCLARVITRSPRFSHSVPLLKSLHWVPVQSRIILKVCTFAYQTVSS